MSATRTPLRFIPISDPIEVRWTPRPSLDYNCFHSKTDREDLRRVISSDILLYHILFSRITKSTLLKPLRLDSLCYMPFNTIRIVLKYYSCNYSVIRGCEIVFESIIRLIYLLRIF